MRHVCVYPAGAQHDSMLKGSLQGSDRRMNIIAATRKANVEICVALDKSWAESQPQLAKVSLGHWLFFFKHHQTGSSEA